MQSNDEQEQTNVTVEYSKAEGYRNTHGSGAFGGVTPQGNIKMDFYTEYQTPRPEAEEGPVQIERELQFGVVMNLNEAESLVDWLERKVERLKEEMEAQPEYDQEE